MNWVRITSVPGVLTPPEAITLMMSTPRFTRSETAPMISSVPETSPPHEVTVTVLTRQGRPRCDDGRLAHRGGQLAISAVKDAKSPIPEVADCRHTRRELIAQRAGDDLVDLLGGEAGDPVQGRVSTVGDEMGVRVDQAGQQRPCVAGHQAVPGT